MPSERIAKLNALFAAELSKLLRRELEFPRGVVVTVVRVETSADLSQTVVWVSVLPNSAETKVLSTLNAARFGFQRQLGRRLVLKSLPKLIYRIDHTEAEAARVEALLDALRRQG